MITTPNSSVDVTSSGPTVISDSAKSESTALARLFSAQPSDPPSITTVTTDATRPVRPPVMTRAPNRVPTIHTSYIQPPTGSIESANTSTSNQPLMESSGVDLEMEKAMNLSSPTKSTDVVVAEVTPQQRQNRKTPPRVTHDAPTSDSVGEPPRKRGLIEWRAKPTLLLSRAFDLNNTGLKQVCVGIEWAANFPVSILFGKLDMPNNFVSMTIDEWNLFKLYFDVIHDHLMQLATPIEDVVIGNSKLVFRYLFNKPTLIIEKENGKFVMQSAIYERLRLCSDLIDETIKECAIGSSRLYRMVMNSHRETAREEDKGLFLELKLLDILKNRGVIAE